MNDKEVSKLVYFVSAVGSAPQRAEQLKEIVLHEHSSAEFKQVVEAVVKLLEESKPYDDQFYSRLQEKLVQAKDDLPVSDGGETKKAERHARQAILSALVV